MRCVLSRTAWVIGKTCTLFIKHLREDMATKIKVYGKAQNSTALGIVHAYVQMFPKTTLAGLRKAFPNSTAPDKGVEEMFLPVAKAEARNAKSDMSLYFVKGDRPITLADGTKVALSQIWTGKSLDNLKAIAAQFDIEAEVNKNPSAALNDSGFAIEYQNGWQPAAPKKKGCLGMVVALVLLAGATAAAIFA